MPFKTLNGFLAVAVCALFFAGCGHANTAALKEPAYRITGGYTAGPLKVNRAEVTFPNKRGDITVPYGAEVKAEATVKFSGNGLFRAAWLVDGRALENVAVTITYGDTLHLDMSGKTVLPAFEPGPHTVTLRVDEPAGVKAIEARYFVTGENIR